MEHHFNELKELEKTYALAAKQCKVTLWKFDFETRTIYNIENSSGIKAFDNLDEIKNVPNVFVEKGSLLHPDDGDAYCDMVDKVLNGAATASSIGRWWDKDFNTWNWFETSYSTIFDADNIPFSAIGTAIDINERIKLEERYDEEIKWRKVHNKDVIGSFKMNLTRNTCEDGQSDNLVILSFQGNGTADDFFEREYMTHLDKKALIQYKKVFNRESLLKAFQSGKTSVSQEAFVRFSADYMVWLNIELDMFQNPKTGDIEAYIYAQDINQKKMSRALVDAVVNIDYDYLALIDALNDDYTIFAKTEGNTPLPPFHSTNYEHEVSEFARKYLVEEDIEKNIHDMSYANIFEQLEKQAIYTTTCRVKESDGRIARKKLQFSFLDKMNKKIMITRSDITDIYNEEQRKNEALKDALVAAQQANHAKSDFLSRMSHEIRTPMNAIIGMAALAANNVNNPEQVSDYLSKVGISARFLLSLINDILDMSRIESGKVAIRADEIPFEEFINGINTICYAQAEEKGIEYDAILTSYTEDKYIGDAMKLQQVLINIIGNAIKFTNRGGKVQFMIHQEKIDHGHALLKFTINDTGIGISEEFLPKLFDPFAQANEGNTSPYGGTGLGLAISKNLINLMGGAIHVNSIKGIGTEFIVEVKLAVCKSNKKEKHLLHLSNLKALIVDDDVIICEHTVQVLRDMKIKAEYVNSGFKAIELVRQKWDKNNSYDIIFVDWKMPNMDGIETTKAIRKIVGPDVTIIIMTAYDWASIEVEAKQAGVNMLLSKPIFKASLSSAFERIYDSKMTKVEKVTQEEFDFSGKRVLLVEDHLLNIEVAKKLLNAKNLEVEVAENGLQAIEMFAQKDNEYYDAILMDIRMPVMDGLTASKSIRQMRKKDALTIPIIAMTANAFEEDIEKTKAAGMNAHLAKPIEPLLLYQTMQHYLVKEIKDNEENRRN
ncbi:MAG: response regulator [Erysipelotrichaceae bacterium]